MPLVPLEEEVEVVVVLAVEVFLRGIAVFIGGAPLGEDMRKSDLGYLFPGLLVADGQGGTGIGIGVIHQAVEHHVEVGGALQGGVVLVRTGSARHRCAILKGAREVARFIFKSS